MPDGRVKHTKGIRHLKDSIAKFSDGDILYGMERHADPSFWKEPAVVGQEAYIKLWGCYLRREARKRGLL